MKYKNVPGAVLTNAEREWLFHTAQEMEAKFTDANLVNIGILWGASLWCLIEGAPDSTVYGIDLDTIPLHHRESCTAVLLQGDSAELADSVKDDVHFLFVDGAHDYKQVRKDIKAWAYKVAENGIMAFHDYNFRPDDEKWDATLPGVKKAVDEWFGMNKLYWQEIPAPNSIKAFMRMYNGD